jgi:predicted NUDIX family NTP pyrophosphohydrolase
VAARSAGILLYRRAAGGLEVLLVHPGGPFWSRRDLGAWSIPKGEADEGEEALACARREFEEETGSLAPADLVELGEIRQRGGKRVQAWAGEGDLDASAITSSTFEMEWPPRSGRLESFPEIDRAAWFEVAEARERLLPAQLPLLDRLAERVGSGGP